MRFRKEGGLTSGKYLIRQRWASCGLKGWPHRNHMYRSTPGRRILKG